MIVNLYRKYVSKEIRDKIYKAFLGSVLLFLRNFPENFKAKNIYLFHCILPKTEENELYSFMGKYGLTFCPYKFMLEYKKLPINYFYDNRQELPYVIHEGKKLYFPQSYNKQLVIETYRNLIIEQDICSPHRYVKDTNRLTGKRLLDIGAAEGIFSLSVIDIVNHVYLFECDENWIRALNVTFSPWAEKVTIIEKYVGESNDENNITIDHFLAGKDKNNLFLKMDIEGYEQAALKGASNTLKEAKDLDYAICTYHRKNDAIEINKILSNNYFESEFTEDFLYYEKEFRKAIIRKAN